nr:helix-turn-helix transcriptional regulator [uncultured Duganella sp.]
MKSVKYLLDLQNQTGSNDAALARLLDLSGPAVSHYKTGRRIMDDETCLKIAMQLNIDPLHVVGAACIDRAEKEGKPTLWSVFMERAAATAAIAVLATSVNLFLTPKDANARTYSPLAKQGISCLYIM